MDNDNYLAAQPRREATSLSLAARALIDAKNFERALEHSNQEIATDPTYASGWIIKAFALLNLAIEAVQKAEELGLDEIDPSETYYLARFHAVIGNNDKALRYLERALERPGISQVAIRTFARNNTEFAAIRDDPKFKELTARK